MKHTRNSLILLNGNVYTGGSFHKTDVMIQDGKFCRIGSVSAAETKSGCPLLDAAGKRVIPGFFDQHTHGGMLVDFNHVQTADLDTVCRYFASCGVSCFFPTVMTDAVETMKEKLDILSDPLVTETYPQIRGIHLEGPFLSPLYKGAMPEKLLQPCDFALFRELQDAARGRIKLITISPELPHAAELIEQLTRCGVRVSLGHSGASYEQATAAIKAGAASATHIMNAMKLLHMHDPAILSAVLESDIFAEMICDGLHLHPPIVRLLLKIKGLDKMIGITDSIMAAGCPDGNYELGVNAITVKDGDATLTETGVRAGSTLTMNAALKNVLRFTGLPAETVLPLFTANPAKLNGMYDLTGSIDVGKYADFAVLDERDTCVCTYAKGIGLYNAL